MKWPSLLVVALCVHIGGTFVEYCDIFVLYLVLPGTNWWACAHIVLEECAYCTLLWHENRELYELCINGIVSIRLFCGSFL